jgi:calcineurin-like phosphoesterase family protein
MIYFTADLHLGHANVISHCSRNFADVTDMDAVILNGINKTVGRADTLWILGDFAFRGHPPGYYRDQINCVNVRLLLGNHDRRSKCENADFAFISDVAEISVGKQRIWLSHYAHRAWPASHRGSWHLYGHSHGALDAEDRASKINALDVGVDNFYANGPAPWTPWSIDDVMRVLPRNAAALSKLKEKLEES